MSSVHDATARIALKSRTRRRRRLVIGGIVAAVIALCALAVWLVGFSNVFAAHKVEVVGVSTVAPEEVSQTAAVPLGRPLVRLDEREIADRVATMPQVQRVTVRRAVPDRVIITVVERTPAYALARGDKWLLVDGAGVAFREVGERPAGMVVAYAPETDAPLLKGLAIVAQAMPPELGRQIEKIEAKSADTITLHLPGRQVLLGSSDQINDKLRVAEGLLRATKAKWIDVTSPGHPATR